MNLKGFYTCQTCNHPILKPDEGWLQWQDNERCEDYSKLKYYGFKVVHHKTFSPLKNKKVNACYPYKNNTKLNDLPLKNFYGYYGMEYLIHILIKKSPEGLYQLASDIEINNSFIRLYNQPYFSTKC